MASSFRKLGPESGEDWIQYVERMEYYFLANEITSSDKQRAVLISAMGAKSYKLLRNLITPKAPSDLAKVCQSKKTIPTPTPSLPAK